MADDVDDDGDDTAPGVRTVVIKTGLQRFCRQPALARQIDTAVQQVTVIAYEGSKLLNLFFLYLVENKLPVPQLNRNWIYTNVYQCVSVQKLEQQPRASPFAQLEHVRQQLYLPCRPSKLAWGRRDNLGQVLKRLSAETLVNCKNHVAVNFHRRLRHWWFSKLTRKLQTQLQRKDRWRLTDNLVAAACKDKTSFAMPGGVQLTVAEIKYLRNKLTELGAECAEDAELCSVDPSHVSVLKLKVHVSALSLTLFANNSQRTQILKF